MNAWARRIVRNRPGRLLSNRGRLRFYLALLVGCAPAFAVLGQAVPARFDTAVVWHDNVTNAERPADLLAALQWRGEVGWGAQRLLPDGHRVRGSAGLRAEAWPRFEGLNVIAPGLGGAWEWKPGLGPHWPVLVAEAEGEWVAAQERGRGGFGAAGRISVRQRLGATWRLAAGHEWRRFDARAMAFDRTGREWFGRLEWNVGEAWTILVEGRRRMGDVVSYSRPPRPDLEALGKPITYVDTFEQDVPWIAYYFRAETRSGAAEVQRLVGRTTLAWRHEYRHTLHAGPGYKNQLTSFRLSRSF